MKKLLMILVIVLPILTKAQEEKKFGIQFSGFVKTDIFYDTRQTDDLREGHFLILPKNISKDELGNDINDQSSFNFLSIQTRLAGTITGPDVLKAKTSAYIEAEFFGTSNADINGFRLRHAYALLDWKKSELMVGQFWHPMFITSCFPGTISFNTGAPFEPFSRNPQIRYTFRFSKFRVIGTVVAQRDFSNQGPNGASSEYLRNSGIPEGNLKLEFNKVDKEKEKEFLCGIGVDYKILQPRLFTTFTSTQNTTDTLILINPADTLYVPTTINKEQNFSTNETLDGLSTFAYFKLKFKPITIKAQATLAQMSENLTMLGGYAVNEITDATKNFRDYTPMNVSSFWMDINSNGTNWEFGIFGGYTKNNGFKTNILEAPYGRGGNIDHVYRISPRIVYKPGKMRFAVELENTVAAYGTMENTNKGLVKDTTNVSNMRLLLAVYYMF